MFVVISITKHIACNVKEKVTFMPDYIEIFVQVYCSFKAYFKS